MSDNNIGISSSIEKKLKYLMNYTSSKVRLSLIYLGFSLTSIIFMYPLLFYSHEIVILIAYVCIILLFLSMSIFLMTSVFFHWIESSILNGLIFKEKALLIGDVIDNIYRKVRVMNKLLSLGMLPFLFAVFLYLFALVFGMIIIIIFIILTTILILFGISIEKINKRTFW